MLTQWLNKLVVTFVSFSKESPINMSIMDSPSKFINEAGINVIIYVAAILIYNSIRNRSKLSRSGLLGPKESPWNKLLNYGDDKSFLEMTGFDRKTWMRLEDVIFPAKERLRSKRGRPSILDDRGQLGLFVFFLGSSMSLSQLCMIFGIVPSSASRFINRMLKKVPVKLRKNRFAQIKFPDETEKQKFALQIANRYPRIQNCIGFMDGLSIHVQCSDDPELQNACYNGYHADTMCNNVFLFGPNGKVLLCAINYPGSWHDSSVCNLMLVTIIENINGFCVSVDQGFPRSGKYFDILVGPLSKTDVTRLSPILKKAMIQRANDHVSIRQGSEWGMRSLQGTWPRLKSRLTSNTAKRKLIIESVVLLNNYRTEFIGLNQIATVFNEFYEQRINFDGYDRISRYFHQDNEEDEDDFENFV